MKKHLNKVSRAFIATMLLFAAMSVGAAQVTVQTWVQEVTVNPVPGLTMPAGPVCQNAGMVLTFTGKPPFKLAYVTNAVGLPGGNADLNGTDTATFKVNAAGNLNLTQIEAPSGPYNVGKYTATIVAGAAGSFYFHNITVTDSNSSCSPVIADVDNFVVNAIPEVTVSTTNHDLELCGGTVITFTATNKQVVMSGGGDDITFSFSGPTSSFINIIYSITETSSSGHTLTTTPSIPTIIPIPAFDIASTTKSYTIGNTDINGVYKFQITTLTATVGNCANTTQLSDGYANLTVHTMPDVAVTPSDNHNLALCLGDTLAFKIQNKKVVMGNSNDSTVFTFTGDGSAPWQDYIKMAYHIESISPTTNTYTFNNPHLASPLSIPAFNLNMPYNVNVNNTSGKYKFTIDSLWATVAPKCVKRSFTDGYANLTVYPAPTIAFSADPICADDALLLTFTGKENASSFTLDYKFTQSPDTTVPNNLKDPASIGLPSSFTPSTSGSVDVNGIQTYTTTINPGRPGVFKFYLHTITDGTCTNTVPAAEATSWKWW